MPVLTYNPVLSSVSVYVTDSLAALVIWRSIVELIFCASFLIFKSAVRAERLGTEMLTRTAIIAKAASKSTVRYALGHLKGLDMAFMSNISWSF